MPRLLLLPGMDGTGDLFAPFAAEVSAWASVQIVRYPTDVAHSIDELVERIELDAPVTVIAESFSTAVGIRLAARAPELVERLVLVGAFVTPPPGALLLRAFGRLPFLVGPPAWASRRFLVGRDANDELVALVAAAIARVSPSVLADRLAHISRVDEAARLRALRLPVLTVSATKDRLVPARVTEALRAALPAAQHAELDGPHLLLQARPREAAQRIRAFVGA